MGAAELAFVVKAIDQASGTLDHVGNKVGGLHGALGKLGGLAGGALVAGVGAGVAAVGGLSVVLKQSFDAASEAEDIQAQLNAVLKSTKGVAGVSADAINDHALELSKMTKFEDDAIVAADALLLTFTNIGKEVFPDATEATLDVAQAMGMDLKSASMLVGKALNDPTKGMTALTRAGIQFTQKQKDTIKALMDTGKAADAQRIILKELETQVGGSAAAAGKTLSGQMEILKNSIGNVKEEIGGALLPIVQDAVTWIGPKLVEAFTKLSDWVPDAADKLRSFVGDVQTGIGQIKKAFADKGILGAIDETWGLITGHISEAIAKIDWDQIKEDITGYWDTTLQPALKTGIANLKTWTTENQEELATDIADAIWPIIELAFKKSPEGKDVSKSFWDSIAEQFKKPIGVPATMQTAINALMDELLKNAIADHPIVGTYLDTLKQFIQNIKDAETERAAFSSALQMGLVNPFAGIAAAAWEVADAIGHAVDKYWQWINAVGSGGGGRSGAGGDTSGWPYVPMVTAPSPTRPAGTAGSTGIPGAGRAPTMPVNITINAPGGNPAAVAKAAQQGVLAAARSMGIR